MGLGGGIVYGLDVTHSRRRHQWHLRLEMSIFTQQIDGQLRGLQTGMRNTRPLKAVLAHRMFLTELRLYSPPANRTVSRHRRCDQRRGNGESHSRNAVHGCSLFNMLRHESN